MVLILVLIFSAAWLPYASVTLVGQFGPPGTLSQWVTALPAVFAKCSVVFNPIVYGIAHKHFRRTVSGGRQGGGEGERGVVGEGREGRLDNTK